MQQFRLIGIVPLGIGLTVIVFLWTASGFGAPPLIFRVFGSFVALGFVITGGAILFGTSMLSGANGGIAQLLKRAQNSAKDLDAPDSALRKWAMTAQVVEPASIATQTFHPAATSNAHTATVGSISTSHRFRDVICRKESL
jgi:Sec-independent protein translocase protein TatA